MAPPFLLLNILTSDSLACKRQQNAFLSTASGLALSLESFATKPARIGLMVDRPLSFVACIAGRSAGFAASFRWATVGGVNWVRLSPGN